MYIPTLSIITVEKVEQQITKKALSFKLVTKSGVQFLSVECTDKATERKGEEADMNKWLDFLVSIARVCDGTVV
jgi:hypothetical protein